MSANKKFAFPSKGITSSYFQGYLGIAETHHRARLATQGKHTDMAGSNCCRVDARHGDEVFHVLIEWFCTNLESCMRT
jgi:hypothetical protein